MTMMTWRVLRPLLAAGAGLAMGASAQTPAPAPAKVDPARGQQVAQQICGACHAVDGNSTLPANPKLAHQHADYLYKQLLDYTVRQGQKQPARENPIMNGIAAQVTDEDKRHVAAWYATQAAKPDTARNKQTLELGQRIWRAGIPAKALPACGGCHGPTGAGIPALYPRLAGQHAEYTETTLRAFREGTRRNNPAMQAIAVRLSDAEIRAVADYVQGLRR